MIREEPIKEANKEGEIITEMPKQEILIENDLEKSKSEIIEIVWVFEENRLNNEELIREEPIKAANKR